MRYFNSGGKTSTKRETRSDVPRSSKNKKESEAEYRFVTSMYVTPMGRKNKR